MTQRTEDEIIADIQRIKSESTEPNANLESLREQSIQFKTELYELRNPVIVITPKESTQEEIDKQNRIDELTTKKEKLTITHKELVEYLNLKGV